MLRWWVLLVVLRLYRGRAVVGRAHRVAGGGGRVGSRMVVNRVVAVWSRRQRRGLVVVLGRGLVDRGREGSRLLGEHFAA